MTEAPVTVAGGSLRWTVAATDQGARVELSGEIDENADFPALARALDGEVELDLAGVTRINSCGVREWVNFVRTLPSITRLDLVRCPPAIVAQLNTIYNFRGRARVRSLLVPYVCEPCGVEEQRLVEVDAGRRVTLPHFLCERCGGTLEIDDLPERYLAFLEDV